jgi:hypothetical protein
MAGGFGCGFETIRHLEGLGIRIPENSSSRAPQARKKREVDTSEGTSAEDDSADGSLGRAIRNANVTAALMLVDGHLRDDGNAHTGACHAEDAAELATFENHLGIDIATEIATDSTFW